MFARLFLEFPSATPDQHPLDLMLRIQSWFGASLLVAPFRYPDELDSYAVIRHLGDWYNLWTGARDRRRENRPRLDVLPVYAFRRFRYSHAA